MAYLARKEIIDAVLPWCSPFDLVQLRRMSKATRRVIEESPGHWISARKNLDNIPSPPVVSAAGQWSEAAYASFLFGKSACAVCARQTGGLPSSFALRFRCCSDTCRTKIEKFVLLVKIGTLRLTPNGISGFMCNFRHWSFLAAAQAQSHDELELRPWLPPQHRTGFFVPESAVTANVAELDQAFRLTMGMAKRGDALEYVARTRDELKQEWARRHASWPLLLKNHLDLVQWAVKYCSPMVDIVDPAGKIVRQESIHEINVARVRRFAESQGLSPEDTLATPTIQKYLKYFSRDKTPLFVSSLLLLKGSVFTDLEILRLHRDSFFPVSTGNSTAGQASRSRTMQQQATKAQRDGKSSHASEVQVHCGHKDCRRNNKRYGEKGLRAHTEQVHRNN
ncbi:hypothetical protein DFH06DRAFT_1477832 [Mycena polygramma]|nr:hypothetical protein DFH06DRAFT_1477832 [Mycena polygramma]